MFMNDKAIWSSLLSLMVGCIPPSHPRYGAWSGLGGTHWPPPRVMTPLVETAPASPGSLVASTRTALE